MLTTDRIRIVSALVFSLAIHAGIMNLKSGWLHPDKQGVTVSRRVTMTLTARQPPTVVPPVEVIESQAVVPGNKVFSDGEQQTFQKIEKVVVKEVPRPVVVPSEKKTIVEPKTTREKSTPKSVQEVAVQQQQSVSPPISENIVQKTVTENHMAQEIPALMPVTLARPLYRNNPRPSYPSIARRRRYQGTTLLEVLVDSRGRVGDLRVLESCGHEVLDRAALKAVKDWSFEPGRRGDDKVDMWVRVPVRFQLR